jgi:hypothetical protein
VTSCKLAAADQSWATTSDSPMPLQHLMLDIIVWVFTNSTQCTFDRISFCSSVPRFGIGKEQPTRRGALNFKYHQGMSETLPVSIRTVSLTPPTCSGNLHVTTTLRRARLSRNTSILRHSRESPCTRAYPKANLQAVIAKVRSPTVIE